MFGRQRWRRIGAMAGLVSSLGLLGAGSATAASDFKVIASKLDNPRGLAFGTDGALYVAEAGRGGAGPCIPSPEGGDACYGATGAVTRIANGRQERIVTGLPSIAVAGGTNATGPHDVAPNGNGRAVVAIGLGANPAARSQLGPEGANFGQLVQINGRGVWRPVADVAGYEATANPDGGAIDSNPYSLIVQGGRRIVADAGANALLGVGANGRIATLAVFPDRLVAAPPFLGLPSGAQIPMQAVPNAVAVGPDGAYYVGQLTGFPFPAGGARVYRVVPGSQPTIYADGFTNIIDITFGPDGSLYVLEIAANSLLSGDPTGALIRIAPDGSRTTIAGEGLVSPASVVVSSDGTLYVSNHGTSAGEGEVIRIDH